MTDAQEALVERLRHCSANTRDEYLHELAGRAADELDALRAELAKVKAKGDALAGATQTLVTVALESGSGDDIVAQFYPGRKSRNGQPLDSVAKSVRRAINEARAALAAWEGRE